MGNILKELENLKKYIENSVQINIQKEIDINLHIEKLNKIISTTVEEETKLTLKETVVFLGKELDRQRDMSDAEKDLLRQIELLQESIEIASLRETEYGLKILAVQEEERKRVARELHDSIVQSISSLIYKTEFCSKIVNTDVIKAKLELQIMIKSLKNIISEMRNTIYNLRPSVVEEDNLDMLITKHVNYINSVNTNINFAYKEAGSRKRINAVHCMAIFRVIQEACQNAIKHSEASNVSIEVWYKEKSLDVKISDNGKGFEIEDSLQPGAKEEHFGISIMRERVKLLRGDFNIESDINLGTRISIHVENVYRGEGEDNGSN